MTRRRPPPAPAPLANVLIHRFDTIITVGDGFARIPAIDATLGRFNVKAALAMRRPPGRAQC